MKYLRNRCQIITSFFYEFIIIWLFWLSTLTYKNKSLMWLNIANLLWTHLLKPLFSFNGHICNAITFTGCDNNIIKRLGNIIWNKVIKRIRINVAFKYFWKYHFVILFIYYYHMETFVVALFVCIYSNFLIIYCNFSFGKITAITTTCWSLYNIHFPIIWFIYHRLF